MFPVVTGWLVMASEQPGPYHRPIKIVSIIVNKKYVKDWKNRAQIISVNHISLDLDRNI